MHRVLLTNFPVEQLLRYGASAELLDSQMRTARQRASGDLQAEWDIGQWSGEHSRTFTNIRD